MMEGAGILYRLTLVLGSPQEVERRSQLPALNQSVPFMKGARMSRKRMPRFPFEPEDLKSTSNPELDELSSEVIALRGVCVLLISLLDCATKEGFMNELLRAATYADKRVADPSTALDRSFVSHFSKHLRTIAKEARATVAPLDHDA